MIPRYRAWIKEDKEMIEVDEIHFKNGELDFIGDAITWMCKSNDCVLMQSTGLDDKNGKEIFEGDILTTGKRTGVVKNHRTLGFYINDARGDNWWFGSDVDLAEFEDFTRDVAEKIEILGNIHENPELLEVSS